MKVRQKKILVVDDEDIIRSIIKRKIIAATDFAIEEAIDGKDALEKLQASQFDLIITDIKMPRMTGLELIAAMRASGIDSPVIIITGYGTLNDAIEAIRLGAVNFVKKPFQTNELLGVIDRVFTIHEEKVSMRDVVQFITGQGVTLSLPNDHLLFQGAIAFVNEVVKGSWPEYAKSAIDLKICVYESLLNALEHGNLEIPSDEKENLLEESTESYEEYVEERRFQEPYASRKILLELNIESDKLTISVEDDGSGFDHEDLPDPTDPENLMKNLGRGILLIQNMMDEVEFNDAGNRITMTLLRQSLAGSKKTSE